MQRSGVRPSVCLSRRSTAAAVAGGFAAERSVDRAKSAGHRCCCYCTKKSVFYRWRCERAMRTVQVAPKSGPRPQIRCFRLSGTQFLPVGSVESNAVVVYISQLASTAAVYRLQNRQLTFATYGAPALIDIN